MSLGEWFGSLASPTAFSLSYVGVAITRYNRRTSSLMRQPPLLHIFCQQGEGHVMVSTPATTLGITFG